MVKRFSLTYWWKPNTNYHEESESPGSNGNEGVLYIPSRSRTEALPFGVVKSNVSTLIEDITIQPLPAGLS